MDKALHVTLEPPRFEASRTLLVAGLRARNSFETNRGIPLQWQRFKPYIGNIPGQIGCVAYGVCCNSDDAGNFDYIAGVEVAQFADLPAEFARVRIPAQRYAVFTHRGHVSTLRATVHGIWNNWLPTSGRELADSPDFERYGDTFDSTTESGIVEVWLPIKC